MTEKKEIIGGKVGRPTEYKEEFCQMLIDHMSEGYSFESFGGIVGVSERVLYDWEKKFPEFLHSKPNMKASSNSNTSMHKLNLRV